MTEQEIREDFEKSLLEGKLFDYVGDKQHLVERNDNGEYTSSLSNCIWRVWQIAARTYVDAPVEAVREVAQVAHYGGLRGLTMDQALIKIRELSLRWMGKDPRHKTP